MIHFEQVVGIQRTWKCRKTLESINQMNGNCKVSLLGLNYKEVKWFGHTERA